MKTFFIHNSLSNVCRELMQKEFNKTGRRRWNERLGRLSEWVAAGLLIIKGYRILGRRQRTPFGELDLIAVRGNRLAFVEVKLRCSFRDAETAIDRRQAGRMARSAEYWMWRHRRYRKCEIGLDAIYLTRAALPCHVYNALQPI